MDKAIDGRERHSLVWEDLAPFAEWLIGCDHHGPPLVTRGDQLEQDARLGLILGDLGDVVEDKQIVAVELDAFEGQFATSNLDPLHEISGADAAERLSLGCSRGAPPSAHSAFCRPSASARPVPHTGDALSSSRPPHQTKVASVTPKRTGTLSYVLRGRFPYGSTRPGDNPKCAKGHRIKLTLGFVTPRNERPPCWPIPILPLSSIKVRKADGNSLELR